MLRSNGEASRDSIRSISWSRLSTRFGCARKTLSSLNSVPLSATTTPCGRTQVARRDIERPAGEPHRARLLGPQIFRQRARAPQNALDAREQLARIERLGQIVVGAHFQADDAIGFLAARGEHDDRNLRAGAHVAAQREPVVARQHHVEHDDVRPRRFERRPHALAVGDRGDAVAVLLQVIAQQAADFEVVVDDQHVILRIHDVCIPRATARAGKKLYRSVTRPRR